VIGVPAIVTVDWLGLDVAEWKRYASAFHATLVAKRGSPEYRQAVEVDFPYLEERTREVIAARRVVATRDALEKLQEALALTAREKTS